MWVEIAAILGATAAAVNCQRPVRRLGAPAPGLQHAPQRTLVEILDLVQAQLSTGASLSEGWGRVLHEHVEATGPSIARLATISRGERRQTVFVQHLRAVVAAGQISTTLGAPAAPALAAVSRAINAHNSSQTQIAAAVSGAVSSARIVALLPLAGLALGIGMGARPWQTFTDGAWGTGAAALGLLLLIAGWQWMSLLISNVKTLT